MSDHIPDAGKMIGLTMSKCSCKAKDDYECICWQNTVETKVQILERELAEAKASLDRGAETAAKMLDATIKERDEARECLSHAIIHLGNDENAGPWSVKVLERWRKAAGMEEQ